MARGLGQDQIDFIKKNVKKLGSCKAVKELYNKDCAVDNYANAYAWRIFEKGKEK